MKEEHLLLKCFQLLLSHKINVEIDTYHTLANLLHHICVRTQHTHRHIFSLNMHGN